MPICRSTIIMLNANTFLLFAQPTKMLMATDAGTMSTVSAAVDRDTRHRPVAVLTAGA